MSDLKTNRADFLGVFPQILDDLKNYVTENYKGIPENALQWFEEVRSFRAQPAIYLVTFTNYRAALEPEHKHRWR